MSTATNSVRGVVHTKFAEGRVVNGGGRRTVRHDLELRPRMAMVYAIVPVPALRHIAAIDQVRWIDIEKSASLELSLDE